MTERKSVLLRLDPAVHGALARWAGDELCSTDAQIEFLLRRALADVGRPPVAGAPAGPGRCNDGQADSGQGVTRSSQPKPGDP